MTETYRSVKHMFFCFHWWGDQ